MDNGFEILGMVMFAFTGFMIIMLFANLFMTFSFAKAVGYDKPALAFIPIGLISNAVFIESLSIASGSETKHAMLWALLCFVPLLNFVALILMIIKLFTSVSEFCNVYGKSMLASVLLTILLPGIGSLIVVSGFKKAYLEANEGV